MATAGNGQQACETSGCEGVAEVCIAWRTPIMRGPALWHHCRVCAQTILDGFGPIVQVRIFDMPDGEWIERQPGFTAAKGA